MKYKIGQKVVGIDSYKKVVGEIIGFYISPISGREIAIVYSEGRTDLKAVCCSKCFDCWTFLETEMELVDLTSEHQRIALKNTIKNLKTILNEMEASL